MESFDSLNDIIVAAYSAQEELQRITQGKDPHYVERSILGMQSSPYSHDLVTKYSKAPIPLWVMLELVSFGTLLKLYSHCFGKDGVVADSEEKKKYKENKQLLRCVQQLRNAAAHNDCLLNGIAVHGRVKGAHGKVRRALVSTYGMDNQLVASTSSVHLAMDLGALLICYANYVPMGNSRRYAADALSSAADRFDEHLDWFSKTFAVNDFLSYAIALFRTFSEALS